MSAILADGVKPTLAELERFEEQPEGKKEIIKIIILQQVANFTYTYVR